MERASLAHPTVALAPPTTDADQSRTNHDVLARLLTHLQHRNLPTIHGFTFTVTFSLTSLHVVPVEVRKQQPSFFLQGVARGDWSRPMPECSSEQIPVNEPSKSGDTRPPVKQNKRESMNVSNQELRSRAPGNHSFDLFKFLSTTINRAIYTSANASHVSAEAVTSILSPHWRLTPLAPPRCSCRTQIASMQKLCKHCKAPAGAYQVHPSKFTSTCFVSSAHR